MAMVESRDKAVKRDSESREPLIAQVYDLTATGNLTIFFSQPLF